MTTTDVVDQAIPRRRFLKQSASLAAATACTSLLPAAEAGKGDQAERERDAIPIIDTHQHLWDLSRFRLHWLAGRGPLARNFVTSDYRQATEGLNVVQAIYMEVDVDPAQQREEAEWVIELCRSSEHPTVAAVISGRPASADFAEYISAYRGSPYIKGVRQVLHAASAPPGLCLQDQFVRGIRVLGDLGMRFDLCLRQAELQHAAQLAKLCPDTRFVLDHCGNANPQDFSRSSDASAEQTRRREQWRRDLAQTADCENVVCKISGIVARATPDSWTADELAPIVNHCLDEFGPDRVLFASDWPVCTLNATLKRWVEALRQIVASRSRQQQLKLFHDNAQRFYELS